MRQFSNLVACVQYRIDFSLEKKQNLFRNNTAPSYHFNFLDKGIIDCNSLFLKYLYNIHE